MYRPVTNKTEIRSCAQQPTCGVRRSRDWGRSNKPLRVQERPADYGALDQHNPLVQDRGLPSRRDPRDTRTEREARAVGTQKGQEPAFEPARRSA